MNRKIRTFPRMMKKWLRSMKGKKGQTLVEYALILAFISVVAISVLISLGQQLKSTYTMINSKLGEAAASH
jgi:Flp pilus assembly pilin Flp